MVIDFILRNAKLVTPTGIIDSDLGIREGKIFKTGHISEKGKKERDCNGLFILPGLIDMHVHFRDPGFPAKEDFESGSVAAIAGGVTTIIDMPNTNPPTVTVEALEQKRASALAKSHCNFGFYMGFTGHNLEEIKNTANIAGVKVYMGGTTGNLLQQDVHVIEKLFALGKFVIVHAEMEAIIREEQEKYRDTEDPSVHSLIRSRQAAYEATRAILHCAKKSNAHVHITHISTAKEVSELEKFRSTTVTADTTPHHLYLTEMAYKERGNFVKVNPPLRTNADRQALWNGLRSGTIQAIASDHAPHTKAEKEKSYRDAPAGVPGIETMLSLLLDSVNHGELALRDVARLTAETPAQILGIKNKGKIEAGYDADLAIVDMNRESEVGSHGFFTKCGWSPFSGWKLKGWPVMTVVGGVIGFENGKLNLACRGKEALFSL